MIDYRFWRRSLLIALVLAAVSATAQEADLSTVKHQSEQTALEVPSTQEGLLSRESSYTESVAAGEAENQGGLSDTPATGTEEPVLPHDLSPWGMFMQADWVVKAVMIGLVLASVATWTVLVAKTRELHVLVRRQRQTLGVVSDAESVKSAYDELNKGQGSTDLTRAAAKELKLSANTLADAVGVKERVASCLERLEAAAGRRITRGTSILATIGATAPFVGLFGTVWGIMNSFIGISKAQTTNLAVVAPGIAEALLATALGLIAAIPAVVIYNHFARQISAYKALVGDTSAAILRLVSRDLSRYAVQGRNPVGVE